MKNLVASVCYAFLVWLLGVSFFLESFYVPLLKNSELQANLVLAVAIIPNACLGTYLFYRKEELSSLLLAFIYVFVAVVLDAFITVPLFILPEGGTYQSFFGALSFSLIALEYFVIVFVYGRFLTSKPSKAILS